MFGTCHKKKKAVPNFISRTTLTGSKIKLPDWVALLIFEHTSVSEYVWVSVWLKLKGYSCSLPYCLPWPTVLPPYSSALGRLIKCSLMVCKDFIPVHVTELKVMGNSTLNVHFIIWLWYRKEIRNKYRKANRIFNIFITVFRILKSPLLIALT